MLYNMQKRITPARIIILGFMGLILFGTVLLMLPISTQTPGGSGFIQSLFTATSATCVTGLIVQDTATYWSPFGQVVILMLIQIGGMGVVTMAIAITMFTGRRIGLKQRWVMQESISAPQVGGIVRMTGFVLKSTLLIEGIGALLLAFRFCPEFGFLKGIWYGVFHSISAFCNAGFDLMGVKVPFSSVTSYADDPLVNGTIMALIVVGGIGFVTWADIREHKLRLRAYRLQTKLVLLTTAGLLVTATLFFFCYEFSLPQWDGLSFGEKLLAAMFQAVSPRTAGFNTVDLTQLSRASVLVTILLMITGGSPGSTAGGYKTTTLAVLLLNVWAVIRQKSNVQGFGRRLPEEILRRATTIFMLYLILFCTGGLLICCIDGVPLYMALYETASAIGTVGLSLGITPGLSVSSHLILIFLMYFGRVGGLTLIFAVVFHDRYPAQLPQEQITVG